MITDNYSKMMSDTGMRSMLPTSEELGLMMMGTCSSDRERELNMYRSGSAPPTVEGSLNAAGGLFAGGSFGMTAEYGGTSEEELRSDPAYIPYYYTNVNLNPSLPPPLLSMEDQRLAQRLQGGGGGGGSRNSAIGDRRNVNRDNGSNGRSLIASQLGFTGSNDENNGLPELRPLQGGGTEWGGNGLIGFPGLGIGSRQKSISEIIQDDISQSASSSRHPFRASGRNTFSDNVEPSESQFAHHHQDLASMDTLRSRANLQGMPSPSLGASMARTTTPDPQLMARLAGPRVPPIGGPRVSSLNTHEPSDLVSALSNLTLSTNGLVDEANHSNSYLNNLGLGGSPSHYQTLESQNSSFSSYGLGGGYVGSPSMAASHGGGGSPPALFDKYAVAAAMGVSGIDPRAIGGGFAPVDRENGNESFLELLALQKAYLSAHKSNYGLRSGISNHGSYGNSGYGLGMSYDMSPRFSLGTRNLAGGVMGSMDESFASTLLEEFKNNKTRCFELSEITGHVVDFSADQYGSRFIQQKLESATTEDKNMVFHEIMPQALSLMTDVFGNYVIQKFFEHGTSPQIREMADQLIGHVLTLSLQMYGCRVIQKAIEVVDLDQQTKMVAELDGHVMRCVRDQNGNHVIQKCIECIPEDAINFIISTFYDQVVTLSTHPYGCRVIQRVLEHCVDPKTQKIVMDEILKSVSMLAQDQYGNYVVQHVLQHGKPHERACIINQLSGLIVPMSLQKFASNVVEKCLTFGTPEERRNLVTEMLGTTDENEPLQAMMKDQFGNYVVQKVLETCDDQQLEMILNRIKVHLNALKKYTYGKHIVARVEKLVAAGERRIGILAGYSAASGS